MVNEPFSHPDEPYGPFRTDPGEMTLADALTAQTPMGAESLVGFSTVSLMGPICCAIRKGHRGEAHQALCS